MSSDKPLPITKVMVWKAYQQVKRNGQAAGVDGQSLDDFNKDLENNLYKLWNRMASGSYLPPPVRRVEIPKSGGGIRPLAGCPTQLRDPLQQNGSHLIGWAGSHESVGLRNQSKFSWHPVPSSMVS